MKILRFLLLIVFVLITLFFIISILLPSEYKVSRSRVMNYPAEKIFTEINSFKNWAHWSPWLKTDSTIQNTYDGPLSGVGSEMSWTSAKSGAGSMKIVGSYPNDSIVCTLLFKEFGMTSTIRFLLQKDSAGQGVKVTWINEGTLGFISRGMGLMMDAMMGKDYETGLQNLDTYLSTSPTASMQIIEETVPEIFVMSIQETCTPQEIGATLGKLYGEILIAAQIEKNEQSGTPFAIFRNFSEDRVEMEACIQVKNMSKGSDRIRAWKRDATKSVRGDYYGPYTGLRSAYPQVTEWISQHGLKVSGSPWENYITDPGQEKDSSKWLTQIYFPVGN